MCVNRARLRNKNPACSGCARYTTHTSHDTERQMRERENGGAAVEYVPSLPPSSQTCSTSQPSRCNGLVLGYSFAVVKETWICRGLWELDGTVKELCEMCVVLYDHVVIATVICRVTSPETPQIAGVGGWILVWEGVSTGWRSAWKIGINERKYGGTGAVLGKDVFLQLHACSEEPPSCE